jgi:hypothetical protein
MKRGFMIVILLFLLVLSSCAGLRVGRTKEQAALAEDVHKGVRGITLDFVRNNPPDVVYTGNPLDIVVEVKNEGAVDVVVGVLHLSGYDPRIFSITPKFKTFNLQGRSRFTTFADTLAISFRSGDIGLPGGTESLNQRFLASVCYPYRTEIRVPVCIDPDPTSVLETEACQVTQFVPGVGGGQGGPVGVTSIREEAAPGRVSFLITVANLGDGVVVDRNSLGRCPDDLKFNDVDNVYYAGITLAGASPVSCKPDTKVTLANKQGTIFCTFNIVDGQAFQSILEINLDYGYLSTKTRDIRVRSLT